MAEILQSPLRASSSFSCLSTLFFVHSHTRFSKPSRYSNFSYSIPSFGPLRSPNRRERFRNILSKLNPHSHSDSDSDSDSNSEDFGLISVVEHSDGSFIFRFGDAKDKEAMVSEKVTERSNDSEKVEARSETQQRSNKTQVTAEAKTFIDDGISSSVNVGLSCYNSSVVEISVDGKILSSAIDSGFDEDIEGIYEDESSELNSGSVAISNVNETCVTSMSKSEVLSLDEEKNYVATIMSAETTLDEDSDEIVIVKPIEALVENEKCLDEEDFTRTLDGTETSIQLGHTESSTDEVKVEEIKDGIDIVEELPAPEEALEVEEIKDEMDTVEELLVPEALEAEEIKDEMDIVEELLVPEALEVEEIKDEMDIVEELLVPEALKVEEIKDEMDIVEELLVPEALGVEEIKDEIDIVEELLVPEALEVEEIKDEINVVENLPVSEGLEVEETPKREEISTGEFVLSTGASLLRHPTEGLTGGEDAYFVTCENWLGVADGVGQWSLEGISDGRYAQELMENCERIVSDREAIPLSNPSEVLVRSVAETESSGSSTILVAHFDGQAFKVANIGDSGFIIIRKGSVFQQSSPIVHEFNFPLHVERGDDPRELIEAYEIELDEGDVIVTATDGLFDNLYDKEIASFVLKSLEAGLEPQGIAESLCSKAQEMARSSSMRTPFSDAAQKAGYSGYSGGKLDNVVVIVSVVEKK